MSWESLICCSPGRSSTIFLANSGSRWIWTSPSWAEGWKTVAVCSLASQCLLRRSWRPGCRWRAENENKLVITTCWLSMGCRKKRTIKFLSWQGDSTQTADRQLVAKESKSISQQAIRRSTGCRPRDRLVPWLHIAGYRWTTARKDNLNRSSNKSILQVPADEELQRRQTCAQANWSTAWSGENKLRPYNGWLETSRMFPYLLSVYSHETGTPPPKKVTLVT